MSVKATNWAWHHSPRSITGNTFMVLMALADIADDDGLCVYGPREKRLQEALADKARVSRRTWQRSQNELLDAGVVIVEMSGRENVYRLNMRQPVVLVTPDETGVILSSDDTGDASDAPTVAHHKDVLTKDLKQSVPELTTEALALRADDEISSSKRLSARAQLRRTKTRKLMDFDALYAEVDWVFEGLPEGERKRYIFVIALMILGKAAVAKTDPFDPTRYVSKSIEDEPAVWAKVGFELYARAS